MIESKALVNSEVAAVEVRVIVSGREYDATGYAKKHPKDEPDERIGLLLAYARALEDLVDELEEEARFLIDNPTGTKSLGEWWGDLVGRSGSATLKAG